MINDYYYFYFNVIAVHINKGLGVLFKKIFKKLMLLL